MSSHDDELRQLREGVHCGALLERLPPPWALDKAESSRGSLKYRRGKGEIIIVNHAGRGWWDAGGTAKGDVFGLVQHLRPELTFGQICRLLRDFLGLAPTFPRYERRAESAAPVPPADRWVKRRVIRPRSPAWRYLAGERRLPAFVLRAAVAADVVREGSHGTAWFAHRDHAGVLTGFEMRGPAFRGFAKGGDKTLFRLPGQTPAKMAAPRRLAVVEAPIDALSLAALERLAGDTLYVATSGGMGPHTIDALQQLLAVVATHPDAVLAAATDSDDAGERYAAMLAAWAGLAGAAYQRLRPPDGLKDWNDVLRQQHRV